MGGRGLGGDLDLDEQAGRIAQPKTVAGEILRRIERLAAVGFGAFLQVRQVVGETAKREVVQFLAFALDECSPALVLAESFELERAAALRNVETEIRIEPLRRL